MFIVRHAKSSWSDPELSDYDRPLNDRGKSDTPKMAKRLKEKDITIDLMLSSPAKRAITTCNIIAEHLHFPLNKIVTDKRLYHASDEGILNVIRELKNHLHCIMIFGHNPGLTDFVNELMNENIFNIPTCGIVACTLDIDNWSDVKWGIGKRFLYDYPKSKL